MRRIFHYRIEKTITVNDFLKEQGYSRSIIVHLKKTRESLMSNGRWLYVKDFLHPGDVLTVTLLETESSKHIPPIPMKLDIVYEDEDILVVNKPANTPIHPSLNNYENTLANGVADYFYRQQQPYIFRCINRLDRDTTGLTILAKHMLSASILSKELKNRRIHRTYLAIVNGTLTGSGTIDAPIARENDSLITRCVDYEHGESAITHYRSLKSQNGLTLLSLQLETGRTHQIRVHMKHLGYPLIGDFLYYPDYTHIGRQALHSYRLEFSHPITKKAMELSVPLPFDMARLFPAQFSGNQNSCN
ncbi:MAG: RluA family pseudouridine synthase [Lachnospiraceae bacterium]|nr:RluA family pseudouridine synthase [Lachnospiraceae bacterium]